MEFVLCSLLVAVIQAAPTSNNPWVPQNQNQKLLPPQPKPQPQPPGTPNDTNGQTGTSFPMQFGSMHQMPVDGTYQVLAYEKFGQMLPGMNTIKVVIRQNILYFPGDTKTPGKMMRLTFGSNNTIMITPMDGKADPNTPVPPIINNRQNGQATAGNMPPGQNQPSNNGQNINPAQNINQGQNINQTGIAHPSTNSEWGVYVLSGEYFSIAVVGNWTNLKHPPENQTPPATPRNPVNNRLDPRTGGNNTTNATGQPGQQGTVVNPQGGSLVPEPPGPSENRVSRATIVLRRVAN